MRERWRVMMFFAYEVSDLGRVRRIGRETPLRAKTDRDGYKIVRLSRHGVAKDFKVHRLVCVMFNGGPPHRSAQCQHKDGDPSNNVPKNLKWGTPLNNARDRVRHGRQARGENSPRAKFTAAQVRELRRRHAREHRARCRAGFHRVRRGFITQLASEFGCSRNTIMRLLSGRGYA